DDAVAIAGRRTGLGTSSPPRCARWDRGRRIDWQRPGCAARRPRRLGRCWPLGRPVERCGSAERAGSHFVAGLRCVRRERPVLPPQRPPLLPQPPPLPQGPLPGPGAPDSRAGRVGQPSAHLVRSHCGPWFAAVAALEPQFAASARAAPWPKRAGHRRVGPTAAASRAAFAALRAARTRAARAPGEEREPHELRARQGPRALPALLPVSLPVSAVARRRLVASPRGPRGLAPWRRFSVTI